MFYLVVETRRGKFAMVNRAYSAEDAELAKLALEEILAERPDQTFVFWRLGREDLILGASIKNVRIQGALGAQVLVNGE